MTDASHPEFEALIAYLAGELDQARSDTLEEHYFACAECSERLSQIAALGKAVRDSVLRGEFQGVANREVLEQLAAAGVRLRTYEIQPGGSVKCTAAPEDEVLAVVLHGIRGSSVDLAVDMVLPHGGPTTHQVQRDLTVDSARNELVLLSPGHVIRALPRSVLTLRPEGQETRYVMNHTPWQELTS